jgi:hypothetical protein
MMVRHSRGGLSTKDSVECAFGNVHETCDGVRVVVVVEVVVVMVVVVVVVVEVVVAAAAAVVVVVAAAAVVVVVVVVNSGGTCDRVREGIVLFGSATFALFFFIGAVGTVIFDNIFSTYVHTFVFRQGSEVPNWNVLPAVPAHINPKPEGVTLGKVLKKVDVSSNVVGIVDAFSASVEILHEPCHASFDCLNF